MVSGSSIPHGTPPGFESLVASARTAGQHFADLRSCGLRAPSRPAEPVQCCLDKAITPAPGCRITLWPRPLPWMSRLPHSRANSSSRVTNSAMRSDSA